MKPKIELLGNVYALQCLDKVLLASLKIGSIWLTVLGCLVPGLSHLPLTVKQNRIDQPVAQIELLSLELICA